MDKILPVVLIILVLAALFALMGLGWRHRVQRQSGIEPLPEIPAGRATPTLSTDVQYVATTTAGDWLDRVAVHQLGLRTNGAVEVGNDGVLVRRSGATDIWIAADALVEVRTDSGMAGKFVEKDGLVVLSWRLGDTPVDTGLRTRAAAAKKPLLAALTALLAPTDPIHRTERTSDHD